MELEGKMTLLNGDCLVEMDKIPDGSVDLVLADPPYGTTACKWDSVIPFDGMWAQLNRVMKRNGVTVLFSAQPFTSALVCSNLEMFRYQWIWEKEGPSGFLNCAYAPLKVTEDINVFSKATVGSLSKNPMPYRPQGVVRVDALKRNKPNSKWREKWGYGTKANKLNSEDEYTQKYANYPTNVLRFPRDKGGIHPTQKPVALLEYLVRTYTEEGGLVLDFCMGSGSTGVACSLSGRRFVGIERDEGYFKAASKRIREEGRSLWSA